jgi:hypothetical protein
LAGCFDERRSKVSSRAGRSARAHRAATRPRPRPPRAAPPSRRRRSRRPPQSPERRPPHDSR